MIEARPPQAPFRPAVPRPRTEPMDLFAFLRAARANPLTTWFREHFEHLIVTGEGALGRITVVSDPAAIRHILVDNAANYRKDDLQRRVLAPGLGNGLLTAEGEEWRLQRRTLAPIFSARHVAGFQAPMSEAAAVLARRLARRDGQAVDVALEMTRVTLDVLERTIFTHGLPRDPDALGRAITRYFEALGPIDPLDVFGMPDWVPRIGRLRARPALRFFAEVVDELIARRRALLAAGEAPHDLMTLLLRAQDPETGQGLSDLEVKANIVTFIGAGHETTANALTWTLYCLSQDEASRARAEAEIDAAFAAEAQPRADAFPFTRAALEEAIRLFPPVPFMSRQAIADDRLGRIKIPRGSLVTVAPYVLHRHRRLWDDPDAYRPERFLPEFRGRIDRYAYLPFGAGPRVCIGMSFSLMEATLVLAHLLRAVRLDRSPEAGPVVPLHRVTLRPRDGMRMRVTRRESGR
ncbi:cytochrome P450 [Methylobacterium sp. 4-46]|nr:cytochrome P450 [Methylobacterium nodulans]ACA15622.1 cytochrome P450 [Methylobacterium sp. 4-46]WFT81336.1 cytochrome P450 [Methylobacterium nodulans]